MKIEWMKFLKVSGAVATLALGWVGGVNQETIVGKITGDEPSYYERRSIEQLDANIRDNKEYTLRVEQRFEKKFEIIDTKLDRIIDLQLRPRVRFEEEAATPKNKHVQGG
jgi:hypothetical protein